MSNTHNHSSITSAEVEAAATVRLRVFEGCLSNLKRILSQPAPYRTEAIIRSSTLEVVGAKRSLGEVLEYIKSLPTDDSLKVTLVKLYKQYKVLMKAAVKAVHAMNPDLLDTDDLCNPSKLMMIQHPCGHPSPKNDCTTTLGRPSPKWRPYTSFRATRAKR